MKLPKRPKKPAPTTIYNRREVVQCTVKYLSLKEEKTHSAIPLRKLHEEVIEANTNINFPGLGQFRKYILEELMKAGLFQKDDKLNTRTAYRLLEIYDGYIVDLERVLQRSTLEIISEDVIPCAIPLSNSAMMYLLTQIYATKREKSLDACSALILNKICRSIKAMHKDVVIAAIPEPLPITEDRTSSICIYVRNTEKGREFIKSITAENALVQYV